MGTRLAMLIGAITCEHPEREMRERWHRSSDATALHVEERRVTYLFQLSDDATVSALSSLASNMNLNITVNSASGLALASSQVSIAGNANLTVTGTAANPVILGRITLTSGELFFQGTVSTRLFL